MQHIKGPLDTGILHDALSKEGLMSTQMPIMGVIYRTANQHSSMVFTPPSGAVSWASTK
jgi:hypothetical protein